VRNCDGAGVLNGGLIVVRHPRHVRNSHRRGVDVSGIHLDGVVVLRVLVHIAVDTNRGRVAEADTAVLAGRTAHGSATARNTLWSVRTAEGSTTLRDHRARATANGEAWMRVDILVLEIDGVVILVVLVDAGGNIDSDGSGESLTTVVARRTAHSSATLNGLPVTLEGSTEWVEGRRVDLSVLHINGVVILAVLVDIVVDIGGHGVAEAHAVIVAGRTTLSSAARDEGTIESVGLFAAVVVAVLRAVVRAAVVVTATGTTHGSAARDEGTIESVGLFAAVVGAVLRAVVVVTATGTTHGSTTSLVTPALLKRGSRDMVVISVRVGSLAETTRASSKASRRMVRRHGGSKDRRRVNVLVLHLDGVVVLGVLIDGGLDICGDWHVEGLALVVARRATHSSASMVRVQAALGERPLARSVDQWRWVNISVLDLDRVVVLAVLIHSGVGLHIGATIVEATVLIIAGRPAHRGATDMGVVAVSLHALAILL
jgi:hypothetical protein